MGRHPHRAHIFRDSLLPIDAEPRTGTNFRSGLPPPGQGTEHLLINPGDLLPEIEHGIHIANVLPRDILDGDLFEERINRGAIGFWSESIDKARTTIFGITYNNFRRVDNELVIE